MHVILSVFAVSIEDARLWVWPLQWDGGGDGAADGRCPPWWLGHCDVRPAPGAWLCLQGEQTLTLPVP